MLFYAINCTNTNHTQEREEMNSISRLTTLCLLVVVLLIAGTTSSKAGNNAFGFEGNSRGDIIIFADYYINQHLMLHPWLIPSQQGNLVVRLAITAPGFSKFELGAGPKWAAINGTEEIRAISSEFVFHLPLGRGLVWQSYNLGQWSLDGDQNSGLLRQQLKLGQTKAGIFNDNQLRELEKPKIFLGMYYDLAPLRFTSTFKLVFTANIKDLEENRMSLIIEF